VASAEGVSNGHAVLRNPIASELEKIVDVANIELRPNEDPALHVEAHARCEMQLEVIGAFKIVV
jgi:hypothetical protein